MYYPTAYGAVREHPVDQPPAVVPGEPRPVTEGLKKDAHYSYGEKRPAGFTSEAYWAWLTRAQKTLDDYERNYDIHARQAYSTVYLLVFYPQPEFIYDNRFCADLSRQLTQLVNLFYQTPHPEFFSMTLRIWELFDWAHRKGGVVAFQ